MGFEPISVDTLLFSTPPDWSSVDQALGRLCDFDWVVLTSATGARFFSETARLMKRARGSALVAGDRPRFAAVGYMTANKLREEGYAVDFIPSEYTTACLGREFPRNLGTKLLLLRADIASPELSATLRERGFSLEEFAVYRTSRPAGGTDSKVGAADAVVFASPSAVEGFCEMADPRALKRLREKDAFCIGPVTEAAARAHGFRNIVVPRVHLLEALMEEIVKRGDDHA